MGEVARGKYVEEVWWGNMVGKNGGQKGRRRKIGIYWFFLSVLLSALVERFSVSRMRDFFYSLCLKQQYPDSHSWFWQLSEKNIFYCFIIFRDNIYQSKATWHYLHPFQIHLSFYLFKILRELLLLLLLIFWTFLRFWRLLDSGDLGYWWHLGNLGHFGDLDNLASLMDLWGNRDFKYKFKKEKIFGKYWRFRWYKKFGRFVRF